MAKPQDTGVWNTDAEIIEPTAGERLTGFFKNMKPPSQWFNWYWKGVLAWTNWLANIDVDQATNLLSWDINKGANVSNNGANTTTINCSNVSIDSESNNGSISNSDDNEIVRTNNFSINNVITSFHYGNGTSGLNIRNSIGISIGEPGTLSSNINVTDCDDVSVSGLNNSAENSNSCSIKGSNNNVKNCDSVIIPETISRSSVENVDTFTETRSNTKTLQNLRVLGSKIVNSVFDSESIVHIGNTNQNLFGNRYLSQQAEQYWHKEDVNWRVPNLNFANLYIVGGQQSSDGLFATSVELINSSDSIQYPILPSYDEENNQTLSFWAKINVINIAAVNRVIFDYSYDDVNATFGWTIAHDPTSGYNFGVLLGSGASAGIIYGVPIKEDVFQHIVVVFNATKKSYSLYIDSEFLGTIYTDSIVGNSLEVKLKIGNNASGTSMIDAKISDVSFFNSELKSLDIKKMYCGGLLLGAAASGLGKLYSIHKDSNGRFIEDPNIIGIEDDLFVFIKYPEYMKMSNYTTNSEISIFDERYALENF